MRPSDVVNDSVPGYDLLVEIARGSSGIVYRGVQPDFARDVAVKLLGADLGAESWWRFERECQAIGALSGHPSIVTVYEAGKTTAGRPYIVMEYLAGGSLADVLRRRGPRPWREVVPIGIKLASGLEAAHRAGVLHRDVKPGNVLVSRYGEPKLGDFGIARILGHSHTATGVVSATIPHAAPEVLTGDTPGPAADVYSLCSVLYTLLVGHSPFEVRGDEPVARLVMRIATETAPSLPDDVAPPALADVIAAGLAKVPEDRPASAVQLARQLQAVEVAEGVAITPFIFSPVPDEAVEEGGGTVRVNDPTTLPEPRPVQSGRAPARTPRLGGRAVRWGLAGGVGALLVSGVLAGGAWVSGLAKHPAAAASVIFQDQFDSNAAGWATANEQDSGSESFDNGRYRVVANKPDATQVSDTNFVHSPNGQPDLSHLVNATVEVSAHSDLPEGVFGVVCRHNADGRFYEGVIGNGGVVGIFKVATAGSSPQRLTYQTGPITLKTGPWPRIALDCRTGNHGRSVTLALRVDGQPLARTVDRGDPIPSGSAGLAVGAPSTRGAEALFDDFAIKSL